jgi:hypothetical protein
MLMSEISCVEEQCNWVSSEGECKAKCYDKTIKSDCVAKDECFWLEGNGDEETIECVNKVRI